MQKCISRFSLVNAYLFLAFDIQFLMKCILDLEWKYWDTAVYWTAPELHLNCTAPEFADASPRVDHFLSDILDAKIKFSTSSLVG